MSQISLPGVITRIGLLQILILILVLVTAGVHLDRGIMASSGPQGGISASQRGQSGLAGGQGSRGGTGSFTGGQRGQGGRAGGQGGSGISGLRSFGFTLMRLLPVPLSTLFFLNFIVYIVLGA